MIAFHLAGDGIENPQTLPFYAAGEIAGDTSDVIINRLSSKVSSTSEPDSKSNLGGEGFRNAKSQTIPLSLNTCAHDCLLGAYLR